jgi:hypothetical protein
VPKPSRRTPKYLAYIREQACCACVRGTPIEAHHFGPRGTGIKADDYHAVPLCTRCHRHFHDTGNIPHHTRDQTELVLWRAQAWLLVKWLRREQPSDEATSADEAF